MDLLPLIKLNKTKSSLLAIAAIAAGTLGYQANKWNNNRLNVLNSTNAWKKYIELNQFSEKEANSDYAEKLMKDTIRKFELGILEKKDSQFKYLEPPEYTLDKAGAILLANYRDAIGAKDILLLAKELIESKPLKKEENITSQIYEDAKLLMNDSRARKVISQYFRKEETHPWAVYTLAAAIIRAGESIRKDMRNTYDIRFETGFFMDNEGFDRKKGFHSWVMIKGERIEISARSIKDKEYLPIAGRVFKLNIGESNLEKKIRDVNVNVSEVLYVRPNKN